MRRLATATTVIALLSNIACTGEPDRTIELRVLSTDPEVVAHTDQLLLSRFDMFNSAWLTPVTSETDGSVLSYTFPGGDPGSATIEFLFENIGLVTMTLAESPDPDPVITSYDIESFELRRDDSGNELLFFELTPAAGELMLRTSVENIGKQVIMKVDDVVLMEATIRGAFSREFQISGSRIENIEAVYAVIHFGPLPAAVELVSFQDGA